MTSPVVIVTGVSRGIGLCIAQYLLAHEAKPVVIGIARSSPQDAKLSSNASFHLVSGSVDEEKVNKQAVDLALSKYNRLDAVILNAGILDAVNSVANANIDQWRKVFDINVIGPVMLLKHALSHLEKSKGAVVVTSSGAATNPYKSWGAYGSSKAAVNLLASTVAAENPTVFSIAVAPGVVDTQMQSEIRETHKSTMPADQYQRFVDLKTSGQLVDAKIPAAIMANLALRKPMELSGKFLRYNDEKLQSFLN